jgi:hypothetical protein
MEQRERSWPRNSVTIAAIVPRAQRKISMDCWLRSDFGASPDPRSLRRQKIDAIQRGDNFTADEQLLQIIAVAELFVAEDADPKVGGGVSVLVGLDEGRRNEHGDFLSTARATPLTAALPNSQSPTIGPWIFGTWDFVIGWPTGLEPATARITIWSSTIELRPPARSNLEFRFWIAKAKRRKVARQALYFSLRCKPALQPNRTCISSDSSTP